MEEKEQNNSRISPGKAKIASPIHRREQVWLGEKKEERERRDWQGIWEIERYGWGGNCQDFDEEGRGYDSWWLTLRR